MTNLDERFTVECPYVRAREYLADILRPAAAESGPQRLPLTAKFGPVPAELEKTVLVSYAPGSDPMHFDQPWLVSWTPEGGGPFPDFTGDLTVRADETYRTAVLELRGTYKPPLGAAGAAFDAAVGHKIASATAQTLLATLAAGMKTRYDQEEAAKARAQ
ncbi:MAG TPA: hypothetical protein VGZ02_08640 [Candidatus Baltobacteraceae bacterium]|jgi:hypothetical protein|nr:hypothetical protein [Candidatus Baltobacteraceae bacterium]